MNRTRPMAQRGDTTAATAQTLSRRKPPVIAGIAVLGLAMVLGGCGSSPGTPSAGSTSGPSATSAPSTPPATTTTPPTTGTSATTGEAPPATGNGGPTRCSPAVLSGTVQPKDSAAGNRYAELVVTNTGSAPCTLYGYGGLQLIGKDGTPLPTSAPRDEKPGPSLVTVAPGGHAAKLLHWGVVPTGSEPVTGPCQPDPAKLSIIPPDETQPFAVTWDLGPVCAQGTIHNSAYYKA